MSKRRFAIDPAQGVDLTPMIDIVFNLIIFFMIVSELSNLDLEQVSLPFADRAEALTPIERAERLLQVNVLESGLIKVRNKPYTAAPERRASPRLAQLQDLLEAEAAGSPQEPDGTSSLRINVRADRAARFEHVQRVMDACMRERIWRLSLAATQDEGR